ncbi:MAG: membrane protein insertion efficiency factor YidD [Syntrophaceae bacterium]
MSAGARALSWGVRFYRETISQVDGERCKMYPSCSAYSLEAIKKHGFFLGYVMTADRLIHESNEMDDATKIKLKNGQERYYDPVEANDFWWSGK